MNSDDTALERLRAMPCNAGYGEAAEALAQQYESVTCAELHQDVLRRIPAEPRLCTGHRRR